jgi:hypothetical protein
MQAHWVSVTHTFTIKEQNMGKFILGVVVTLAVLYPAVTKNLFASAVDTTNTVVTTTIERAK